MDGWWLLIPLAVVAAIILPKKATYTCKACNWEGSLENLKYVGSAGRRCPDCGSARIDRRWL